MILMFVSIRFDFLTLFIILFYVHRREDTHDGRPVTQRSLVHFFPQTDSDATLPLSQSLTYDTPLSYYMSGPQFSGITVSTTGQNTPKTTIEGHSQSANSLGK